MIVTEAIVIKLFIDGKYCSASDKGTYEIFNLARPSELNGRAASDTPDDVGRAFALARRIALLTHMAPRQWITTDLLVAISNLGLDVTSVMKASFSFKAIIRSQAHPAAWFRL